MTVLHDAVTLHASDTVATALRPLEAGESIRVRGPHEATKMILIEAIGLCHKVAVVDVPVGAKIRKYGEIIGVATQAIRAGQHVHIHNIKTLIDA
jgi:altronate dehydratase small subunit